MEKRLLAFLLLFTAILWNPINALWLYSGTTMAHSLAMTAVLIALPLACLLVRFLILKDRLRLHKRLVNTLFFACFTSVILFVLVALNAALKGPEVKEQGHTGLIFEPNTSANYNTSEFNYTAQINALGLRNREIEVNKVDSVFRIACFGDSWTYGWGVNIENSWPMQLEQVLNSKGIGKVEIINCGQGGQYTETYKNYINKVVPMLKPDLVLVGVLQVDDLAQVFENEFQSADKEEAKQLHSKGYMSKIKGWLQNWLSASFGNFLAKIKAASKSEIDIKGAWRKSANALLNECNTMQHLRFHTLPDSVQAMFLSGDLNPGLIQYYIDFPDRGLIFNDPAHPATQFALNGMKQDFVEMKKTCDEHQAKLVLISMPTNQFTGHLVYRTPMDVLNPYFESHNNIDSMYQAVATNVQIDFINLTNAFRQLQPKDKYFFQYDGHPNELGYLEIAKQLADTLGQKKTLDLP